MRARVTSTNIVSRVVERDRWRGRTRSGLASAMVTEVTKGEYVGGQGERNKRSGIASGFQVTDGETRCAVSTVASDCEQF